MSGEGDKRELSNGAVLAYGDEAGRGSAASSTPVSKPASLSDLVPKIYPDSQPEASATPAAATPAVATATAATAATAAAPAIALDATAIKAELVEERKRGIFFRSLRSTVLSLVVVVAAAIIVVTMIFPILQISGTSMTDTLYDQDIVITMRGADCQTGDVIAFYFNNKVLVKRVIATSGQWVNIDHKGNVTVDGTRLDEPYVSEKALGDCNIDLPYQVPEGRVFVMGDHRTVSVDSRNKTVGCIADEQIVGKLVFCVWPFDRFGLID